jgi:hypothetical protein
MTCAGPSRADLESVLEGGEGYCRTGFGLGDALYLPDSLRCAALCLVRVG